MKVFSLISQGAKVAGKYIVKNSPSILTAIGIGGMIAAVVMATKEPVDIEEEIYDLEKLEERQAASAKEEEVKHPLWPRVKIYIRHYWPTAAVVVTSAGCLIFANRINLKRNAALLAAYQLSMTNLKDLREKITQIDGEKKLQKLEDGIAKDKIDANPVSNSPVILANSGGDFLIYDAPSGRYFKGDIERVRRAVHEINKRLYNENFITLNDFYDELGLENIAIGWKLGWHLKTTDDLLEIKYSSQVNENGEPCLVLQYDVIPLPGFDW